MAEHLFDYDGEMGMQLTNQTLAEVARGLAALSAPADDVDLVERISLLETVKNAAAAAQARDAVVLRGLREEQQREAGRSTARTGVSVAAEIGLARRESPHRGRVLLGVASILEREMPHTRELFARGVVSEYRAMLLVRETACLSRADRMRVDAALAGELAGLSDREVVARARRVAYELDPRSVVGRAARAAADRRVTVRPAPDMMAIVSALVPMAQGVAVYAALAREADGLRAAGDPRGRGQIMADTLVCRVTGGMESKKRVFPKGLAKLIATRDEICRTSWCGAPVRHIDHVIPAHAGGATSAANAQGLCVQCNLVKEHPGWRARPGPDGEVVTTSPSGQEHASWPPPMVGSSAAEECLAWPAWLRPSEHEPGPLVDLFFREFQLERAA